MPLCLDCSKRFDVFFTYSEYGTKPVACAHCQSANVRRRVPRVRVAKSDESRMENLADPSALAGFIKVHVRMLIMFLPRTIHGYECNCQSGYTCFVDHRSFDREVTGANWFPA